jgi:hypothetical protein
MTTADQNIEQAIQAAGANVAPRLTPENIASVIVSETFTMLPSGKVMVCEMTLRNGFTVRGESAVVSKANFKEGIGRDISRENARNKVWELEGYLLQQRLYDPEHGPVSALSLQPHQERVIAERATLDGNIERLFAFTGTEPFRLIDIHEQMRLVRQLNLMRQLRDVLDERIAAFKPA